MRRAIVTAVLVGVELVASGQGRPLPDRDAFFALVRARMSGTRLAENALAYTERSPELRLNPVGRLGTGPVVVSEVYPFPELDLTYRRVIERAGRPVARTELAAQDRRFAARLAAARRGDAGDRARRAAEVRAREAAVQRDVLDAQTFVIEDRAVWDAQPAIRVRFAPRPGARPRTREGRMAAAFAGIAWIHESEHEIMRVVADAVADVSFGFGVIGTLERGSHVETRRRAVNGVWVTTETSFRGSVRALLFRRLELDYRREYFNYRAFDPDRSGWSGPSPAQDHHDGTREKGEPRQGDADFRPVGLHELSRLLAVQHGEVALAEVPNAASDHDGQAESPRRNRRGPRQQHEHLERHRRRQQRRHDHREQPVALIEPERAIDVAALQPFAQQRLTTAARHRVQHEAPDQRSDCRHRRVIRHARGVGRAEHDDQQIVDLRKRQERRVEQRDHEQANSAHAGGPPLDGLEQVSEH